MTEPITVDLTPSGKSVVHGRASSYNNHGCRCDKCTEAWRDYMRPRIKNYRQGKKRKVQAVQINL